VAATAAGTLPSLTGAASGAVGVSGDAAGTLGALSGAADGLFIPSDAAV
jgi:hypothetical protein